VALAAVSVAALAVAQTADAKVWLPVKGPLETGAAVRVAVPGCEAAPGCGRSLRGTRVFLARARTLGRDRSTAPAPRWHLGFLDGDGVLRFRVPDVPSGRYLLIARLTFGRIPQYVPASRPFTVRPPA
jgi:hypothetical protein